LSFGERSSLRTVDLDLASAEQPSPTTSVTSCGVITRPGAQLRQSGWPRSGRPAMTVVRRFDRSRAREMNHQQLNFPCRASALWSVTCRAVSCVCARTPGRVAWFRCRVGGAVAASSLFGFPQRARISRTSSRFGRPSAFHPRFSPKAALANHDPGGYGPPDRVVTGNGQVDGIRQTSAVLPFPPDRDSPRSFVGKALRSRVPLPV